MNTDGVIADLVKQLSTKRRARCFPIQVRSNADRFVEEVLALLFPHFSDTGDCSGERIESEIWQIETRLQSLIDALHTYYPTAHPRSPHEFLTQLPEILQALELDAQAMFYGDPAAVSVDEVILAYPGFYAVAVHRVAHVLHGMGVPLLPRLLAEQAHHRTGVDIHPGATIGRSFAIDHGTGIVIGETATIGNGVKLYQGVTLGALSVQKSLASHKRHPTLEDNVVVYANATILGGETTIGHDSIVGASAWITEPVPAFSVVGRHSEIRPRREVSEELEFNI